MLAAIQMLPIWQHPLALNEWFESGYDFGYFISLLLVNYPPC